MTDLLAIAAECEAATGPDLDLDARVLVALFGGQTLAWDAGAIVTKGGSKILAPRLTASVDAGLALLAEKLPGWGYSLWKGDGNYYPNHNLEVSIWWPTARDSKPLGPHINASAPTLPLALLAAVLRAVAKGE